MVLEGIVDGALLLNEFILIKSLKGSNFQISYLFQFSVIILLFSVLSSEWVKRSRNKKRLLRRVALVTRLPLIVFAFFPGSEEALGGRSVYTSLFLIFFLFYYLYKPVILPTINLLLRFNYTPARFGRLYGYSTQVNKIVTIAATFTFGLLLDWNAYAFTYVYPALAVLGIISIYLLTLIPYEATETGEFRLSFWGAVQQSLQRMLQIVKENKPFRDFELSFMLYGIAWMGSSAVITIFMDKFLNLNYSSFAFYKNAYHFLSILLLPFFGRLIGKIDPRRFGILTFVFFSLYLFFIMLTEYWTWHCDIWGIQLYLSLFIAFLFYGLFTASMTLLWGVGSSYFCKVKEAGDYQGIHLSMVGLRAAFAPLFGVWLYEILQYTGTFLIGIGFLLLAMGLMYFSSLKHQLKH